MRPRNKILVTAITAALMLQAAGGIASARRLEISNTGIRAVWPEMLFVGPEGISTKCRVTMEGTFHSRTISKVSGQLIGFITRAFVQRPCVGEAEIYFLNGVEVLNAVVVPNTLPWHIRYDSFTGTLPNITLLGFQIIGMGVLAEILTVKCLFLSTAARPFFLLLLRETVTGVITGTRAEGRIPRREGPVLCPAELGIVELGSLTLLGNTVRVTIRLVA